MIPWGVPPLEQIEEADARGEIGAFYDDVRATIRSTFVPTVFRALAIHRAYVLPAWTALKPNLATTEAEQLAGRLRVTVVDRLKPIVEGRPRPMVAMPDESRHEIRAVLEAFFYVIPKAFVAVTALREAWEGRPIRGRTGSAPRTVPRGAPPSMPALPLLDQAADDPRIRRVFDDATGVLGRPAVPSLYRTLARWPGYLEAVWESVIDPATLAGYRAAVPALAEAAARGCHEWPLAFALDRATAARSLDAAALASVDAILSGFQRTMPETTFQIARLLRDLDRGPAGARASTT
jgi:hypothetical protein